MARILVLKPGDFQLAPGTRVIKASEYAELQDAEKIIEAANQQAELILQNAREVYEEQKKKGYEEGIQSARIDQADQMFKMVSRSIEYLAGLEGTLANILMSGIRRILGQFDEQEMVISLVKNALQHVRHEKSVTVRVPPTQFAVVQARTSEILADYRGVGFIDVVADERLKTGDCIIESELGVIDASIDVQLKALEQRIRQVNAKAIEKAQAEDSG